MQIFKITPEGLRAIRKQGLIRALPLSLVALATGFYISHANASNTNADGEILPFLIPIGILIVGFGLNRGLNQQLALLKSYTLIFTDSEIIRQQLNTPEIAIPLKEIREIAKYHNGSFSIKGEREPDLIGIPSQIENYQQLAATLNSISSIVIKDKPAFWQNNQSLVAILTLGLMICVYMLDNKIIVALTGLCLVTLLAWSFFKIRQSKNLDDKTRRNAWWVLLVLVSIIGVMVVKLISPAK